MMLNLYLLTTMEVGTAQSRGRKQDSLFINRYKNKEVGRFVLIPPMTDKKQEDRLKPS